MSKQSILLVGIGNPGEKYAFTRHNIGMLIVQEFCKKFNFPTLKTSTKYNSSISVLEKGKLYNKIELREGLIDKEIQKLRNKWLYDKNKSPEDKMPNFSKSDIDMDQINVKLEKLIMYPEVDIHALLPLSYVNLSGTPVRTYLDSNGMKLNSNNNNRLLIVTDDVSQPFGSFKLKFKGSHGGHNGLLDIEKKLGTDKYHRLKVGIAPKDFPDFAKQPGLELADYVLGNFNGKERQELDEIVSKGIDILCDYIHNDLKVVMSKHNT
ncbi:hypothetical protein ABK040_006593 [Willaertia magna]